MCVYVLPALASCILCYTIGLYVVFCVVVGCLLGWGVGGMGVGKRGRGAEDRSQQPAVAVPFFFRPAYISTGFLPRGPEEGLRLIGMHGFVIVARTIAVVPVGVIVTLLLWVCLSDWFLCVSVVDRGLGFPPIYDI